MKNFPQKSINLKVDRSLDNKKLLFLGSSIFYGEANRGLSFIDMLRDNCQTVKITKETLSGTTLANRPYMDNSYIQRLERVVQENHATKPVTQYDALIVQLSTNDFYLGIDEGKLTPYKFRDLSCFDTSTIIGAIEYIISFALKLNPDIQIAFISCPILSSWKNRESYKKFNDEIIPKIINKWNIEFLDLLNYKCKSDELYKIDKKSLKGYFSDEIHPNKLGYEEFLCPIIKDFLENMFIAK